MFNENTSTSVQDLSTDCAIGARIVYQHSKPYGYAPIVAKGQITGIMDYCGRTLIEVKPDSPHLLTRWHDATSIKTYLWKVQ